MTTRREALEMMGLATGSLLLTACAGKVFSKGGDAAANPVTADNKMTDFPWPYEKLDPEACAERSYNGFLKGHCMYGSFYGIVGELADKRGAPYNTFPYRMMDVGAGGGAGWGTLCGALNGAMLAITLLNKEPNPLVDELFGWYQKVPLPDYHPKVVRAEISVTSVSKSPLCHNSVSRWCKLAKVKSFSLERDERCAWLTASVTKKTVEILNAKLDNSFKSSYPLPNSVKECRTCHDIKGTIENTRGKMQCDVCHSNADLASLHPKL
jgi:hypothetical protein